MLSKHEHDLQTVTVRIKLPDTVYLSILGFFTNEH